MRHPSSVEPSGATAAVDAHDAALEVRGRAGLLAPHTVGGARRRLVRRRRRGRGGHGDDGVDLVELGAGDLAVGVVGERVAADEDEGVDLALGGGGEDAGRVEAGMVGDGAPRRADVVTSSQVEGGNGRAGTRG